MKKFGVLRKQKRLQDAALELQLLKEAEEILGRNVWTKVKELEHYKVNYWGINKLLHERNELSDKIQDIKSKIESIKQNQETRFKEVNNPEHNVEEIYEKQKIVVNKIQAEQKDISDIAANIKRSFDGAMAKLDALTSNDVPDSEINSEKAKIEQLKKKFSDLKEKKTISDKKLAKQTAILVKISDSLQSSKNTYKDNAAGNYEIMGKANKALSAYRSKIGLLDNKIITHYNEIGKNISKECFADDDCRKAVKDKFNLCKIMRSLRQSIDYNHNLADR
ncbi:MAG: hypothetical protein ACSHX6_09820 [Akkermansiaceae bacterium]